MRYRPEIDGLRAVAVIPVILFHAGLSGFSGGFVGVDIFFVLSGYLITTILLDDLAADRFSIIRFYERRARRLLPALFVVTAATLPFAWRWMLPSQMVDFGVSLIATALFVSNIFFWRSSGYFDAAAELKPMLHTWSLAVEEQYYLIFPILLYFLWRWKSRLILPALIICTFVSLALAEWATPDMPAASFYLAPTRIWEILIGSICACLLRDRAVARSEMGAIIGILMIVAALTLFGPHTPTPSIWTLVPVIGAAFLILFGREGTAVARILSLRPFVWVGLISYSAYLWHHPILAFSRIRLGKEPSAPLLAILLVAIIALAWLSWKYIEQPFRRPSTSRSTIFSLSGIGLSATVLIGSTLLLTGGLPGRTAPNGAAFAELAAVEDALRQNRGLSPACDSPTPAMSATCMTGPDPSVALWGDSYAMHIAQALRESATQADFVQITLSSCAPLINIATQRRVLPASECLEFNRAALDLILSNDSIKTVIAASAFAYFEYPTVRADGSQVSAAEIPSEIASGIRQLQATLASHGKDLVLVAPPARNGRDLGQCYLWSKTWARDASNCDFGQAEISEIDRKIDQALAPIGADLRVISLANLTCIDRHCSTQIADIPLYRDKGHLTVHGSVALGQKFDLMGAALRP